MRGPCAVLRFVLRIMSLGDLIALWLQTHADMIKSSELLVRFQAIRPQLSVFLSGRHSANLDNELRLQELNIKS
jgi:hypothetical protein